MSTHFRAIRPIQMNELFDGRLESYEIYEIDLPDKLKLKGKGQVRLLSDERNRFVIYGRDDGTVGLMTRQRIDNEPRRILDVIQDAFEIPIYSEHEHQFWDFDTVEEWAAYQDETYEMDMTNIYTDIISYLNGEPDTFSQSAIVETFAEIAKDLVMKDPQLLNVENKSKLMKMIDEVFIKTYAAPIKVTDEGIAKLKLVTTHEKGLPQGFSMVSID